MDYEIFYYIIIGFFAQLVDGALGMAYGVISTTFLLSFGVSPAQASASVHTAEIFTTAASGISHAMFKNVDWGLCRKIVIPGVIGSIIGAYLLTVLPVEYIKPVVASYLLFMGFLILYKSLRNGLSKLLKRKKVPEQPPTIPKKTQYLLTPIGFMGGFLDSLGGGGWGGIVTSSLMSQDTEPRYTIGSVNLAEFVIALSSSMTFYMTIGIDYWLIIVGLIIGGIFAAPFGAYLAQRVPAKVLMFLVGVLVIGISVRLIVMLFL